MKGPNREVNISYHPVRQELEKSHIKSILGVSWRRRKGREGILVSPWSLGQAPEGEQVL